MEANNLRYSLLDRLISIRDSDVLQKISELIGNIDLEKTEIKITNAQKLMLMNSEEDIRNGNTIANDDLNEEEDKWLKGNMDQHCKKCQAVLYLNIGLLITVLKLIQRNSLFY